MMNHDYQESYLFHSISIISKLLLAPLVPSIIVSKADSVHCTLVPALLSVSDLQEDLPDGRPVEDHLDGGVQHPDAGHEGQEEDELVAVLLELKVDRGRKEDGSHEVALGG